MKNKDCPYRYHCKSYAIDKCEGCTENLIRSSINGTYGMSKPFKSNMDTSSENGGLTVNFDPSSAYPDSESFHEYIREIVNKPMSLYSKPKEPKYPKIKNVRISGPCTIIFWEDGTKTVMKCSKIDENHFDAEKAILLAFYRKVTGFSKTRSQKELDKLTVKAYFNGIDEFVKEN